MQFWHFAFLFGTATFTIPVVIHLIFRMRKKRIIFPTLRFLQQSMLKESSRLRLRELLLLLLRCAACILLALSFARPYRTGAVQASANGKPQEDVVIVLDDSPSLLAQEGALLRWTQMKERMSAGLSRYAPGDRVALVVASEPGRAEVELTNNFGAIAAALKSEKPQARRGDLNQALNTGIEILAGSTQPVRRIVVFSDLQSSQIDRGAWAQAAQKAAAAGRGISVEIETPSGIQPARLPNISVSDVRAKSDVWIEGRPISFAVRISNASDNEYPSLAVKLMVDGKVAASRTVGLAPRSSAEVELAPLLNRPGEISGHVEIEVADALPEDDMRFFAVRLRDSLKVLVVEERLGKKDSFLDEGYYVRMALDPRARGAEAGQESAKSGVAAQNYVHVLAVEAAKATPEMYRNTDLVVLVGITALKDVELAALEEAVAGGLNMILFPGRSDGRINEAFYNGPFWKEGRGLLPARPGPLYEGNRSEGRYHQLGEYKAEHTLFKPFVQEMEPHLRLPRYVRHFSPNPADLKAGSEESAQPAAASSNAAPPAPVLAQGLRPAGEVLATLGDGSPFVMERTFGKGSVLMFSFVPRPEATDLPKRKAFVPLLHQAVRHFAGVAVASRRNLIAGDLFDFADAGATPDLPVVLEKPGAARETMNLSGKDHPVADQSGIFTAVFQKGHVSERALWAANMDARESDLIFEDMASLRAVFASNGMDNQAGPGGAGLEPWTDEQKSQAPDWRYFLVAALLCLVFEVIVRDFWS